MVSPSMSPSITLIATLVTTAFTGSDFDSQQNTQSSSNVGFALVSTDSTKDIEWIIELGATDHMTFDQLLLRTTSKAHRTHVSNANGMSSPVISVDIVMLTPSLSLEHTLLVLSLSLSLIISYTGTPLKN